jgi:hypothetical protein
LIDLVKKGIIYTALGNLLISIRKRISMSSFWICVVDLISKRLIEIGISKVPCFKDRNKKDFADWIISKSLPN